MVRWLTRTADVCRHGELTIDNDAEVARTGHCCHRTMPLPFVVSYCIVSSTKQKRIEKLLTVSTVTRCWSAYKALLSTLILIGQCQTLFLLKISTCVQFSCYVVNLRPKIRERDTKWRLADLELTSQRPPRLRSISVHIGAFWRGKQCWNRVAWISVAIVRRTASSHSLLSRTNRNRTPHNNII